jgi:hypothetical protein
MDDREFVMCVSSLVLGISPDELFDEDNNMVAPYTYEEVLGRLVCDIDGVSQEEVDAMLTTKKTGGMYGGLRLVSADWQPEEDDDEV